MFEVLVRDEDRDIWRVYLEKGLHDQALQHCKVSWLVPLHSFVIVYRLSLRLFIAGFTPFLILGTRRRPKERE